MASKFFASKQLGKILSIALCGALLLPALISQSASATSPVFTTSNNDDGTVTLTGCSSNCSLALVIPSTINGKTVTRIGKEAFQGKRLNSISIPNTITTVGQFAFDNNMITSVTIPDSVTTIEQAAFYNNNPLESVTIGSSVKVLGNWSFAANTLKYLTFLGDAPTFQYDPFYSTPYLKTVSVPSDATGFGDTIKGVTISRTGDPIHSSVITTSDNSDGTVTATGCTTSCPVSLTIPRRSFGKVVTAIGDFAFAAANVTAVTIPDSIKTIGNSAFFGSQLSTVTIPASVTSIGTSAFFGNQLSSVTIPGSLTSIADGVFGNNKLTTVSIPSSVTNIGVSTFAGNQLSSVTIPSNVKTIDDSAFANNLLATVTIPASVTYIGMYAFQNNALTSVTFLGNAPTEDGYVFDQNQTLTSVVVPSNSTGFGSTFSDVTVSRTGTPTKPVVAKPSYSFGAGVVGYARVGKQVSATNGTWSGTAPITYTYKWYSCSKTVKTAIKTGSAPTGCSAISGATKSIFKITTKQSKTYVAVLITAKNSGGTASVFTASIGPVK